MCGTESAAATASALAVTFRYHNGPRAQLKLIRTSLHSYGHIWAAIEVLYHCLVEHGSRASAPPPLLVASSAAPGGRQLKCASAAPPPHGAKVQRSSRSA